MVDYYMSQNIDLQAELDVAKVRVCNISIIGEKLKYCVSSLKS